MASLNIAFENQRTADFTPIQVTPNQTTLSGSVSLTGKGLHSGADTKVTIYPAPKDTGIIFSVGGEHIPAVAENVVDLSRGTTLGKNGRRVMTVEHLLSALYGKGVDNAIIDVDGGETPAIDGSAYAYSEAIDSAGVVELESPRRFIRLKEPICVQSGDSFIIAVPAPSFQVSYVLNYDHPMIGSQIRTYVLDESDYGAEIAPARTFVLYEEVAALLDQDLARGGTIDNVIVIWQDRLSSSLRFEDELVRHKILDIIGDFALCGGLVEAEVLAVKSGHRLNNEFARRIRQIVCEESGDSTCTK